MAIKEATEEAKQVLVPVIIGTIFVVAIALLGRIMTAKQ